MKGTKCSHRTDFHDLKYYHYYHSNGEEKKPNKKMKMRGLGFLSGGVKPNHKIPDKTVPPRQTRNDSNDANQEKKRDSLRFILMVISLGLLFFGILWQNQLLPFKTQRLGKPAGKNASPTRFFEPDKPETIKMPVRGRGAEKV